MIYSNKRFQISKIEQLKIWLQSHFWMPQKKIFKIQQSFDLTNIFRFDFLQNTWIKIGISNVFYFSKVIIDTCHISPARVK